MRLVFAHDHRFRRTDGSVYSDVQFGSDYWQRYLDVFDEVTVLCRADERRVDVGQMELSSADGVQFEFLPDLSSLRGQIVERSWARRQAMDAIAEADAVLGRLPSELGLFAVGVARRLGKPWAVEVAGCAWDALWHYGGLGGKVYAPVLWARTRRAVAKAPYALYVTKEFLQRRYPSPGIAEACSNVEIPPPDPALLEHRLNRIRSRSPGDLVVFGLIGSLIGRYKGIQTVLRALPDVRRAHSNVIFRVLGAGDAAPWVQEAERCGVADITYFDGTRPAGQEVFDWLDGIDVYLQPSFREGLPRAFIEAMSRACPGIGSRCGGMPELLRDDCLTQPGSSRRLAQLMARSTATEWQLREAERNWETAGAYGADELADRRRRFYEQLAHAAASQARSRN